MAGDCREGQLGEVRHAEEGKAGTEDFGGMERGGGGGAVQVDLFQTEERASKVFLVCEVLPLCWERGSPDETQYKKKVFLPLESLRPGQQTVGQQPGKNVHNRVEDKRIHNDVDRALLLPLLCRRPWDDPVLKVGPR